jgi:hypothetical protein
MAGHAVVVIEEAVADEDLALRKIRAKTCYNRTTTGLVTTGAVTTGWVCAGAAVGAATIQPAAASATKDLLKNPGISILPDRCGFCGSLSRTKILSRICRAFVASGGRASHELHALP